MSELKQECSELKEEANSPGRPGEEPDEPGGETAVPGDPITYQEGPIGGASKAGGETSASDRDTSSGGHKGDEESSRVVEGESDRESVVDHAGCDGIRPRSRKNERRAETDALCRVQEPGGHLDKRAESGDVGNDQTSQTDGDGVQGAGKRSGKDGATSGTCHNSK